KEQLESDKQMSEYYKTYLPDHKLSYRVESLKAQDTPAVILLSEYARRIQDMSRTLGESFAPETETTLVLNRDNPIIQRLGSLSDENKELVCQQVYDLAQIAHKPLSAEEMARFMQRNVKILQLLTEEK